MRDLQWFEDRIGRPIYRKHTEDKAWGMVTNNVHLDTARYYYELQEKGYEYKDDRKPVDPFNDTSTITIHRAPPEECQSCSSWHAIIYVMEDDLHICDECGVDLAEFNHLPGCSVDEAEYEDAYDSESY